MGQRQNTVAEINGYSFPQDKPCPIVQLQECLDEGGFTKVQNSPQYQKGIQLLLKYKKSNHLFFGIKFPKPNFIIKQGIDVKEVNGLVEIYLIDTQNKKNQYFLIFEGQLLRGKRHNFGVQYIKQGIFYKGFFQNNKYHSWGITSNYKGQWFNGTKYGYGKYQSNYVKDSVNNNFTYEGQWKNDKFDGIGAVNISLNQTDIFLKQDYQCLSKDPVDYQYIGEWLEGFKFGSGKVIKYLKKGSFVQTQIYQGEFMKNLYHGHGKIKNGGGNFQQGRFEKGVLVERM